MATSSSSLGSGTDHDLSAMLVDPFVPETVNRMLNSLGGIPADFVEEMAPEESFYISEGDCLRLGGTGVVYDHMTKLRGSGQEGGGVPPFLGIYQCSNDKNKATVLQVQ